jgi:integrase
MFYNNLMALHAETDPTNSWFLTFATARHRLAPLQIVARPHAAMHYEEVAAFVGKLREREATSALALELCILTAARSGEILGMRWSEIDLDKKIWTVPASRMKAGREHRVPLSPRAVAILGNLAKVKMGEFVLPGHGRGKPLSNMAMEIVLRRMKIEGAAVQVATNSGPRS